MKARGSFAHQSGFFILAAMCVCGLSWAQTFQVTGKTGDSYLNLDETHFVTYTVQLTNSATLSNVVPELIPPVCGEVEIGGEMVNIFDTSFVGYKSGVSWIEGPIPSWANNTTREIAFYIHLFDNPPDHSICTDLCPSGVRFELDFTSDSLSMPVTAGSSAYLNMTRPTSNVIGLTDRAAWFHDYLGMIQLFLPFDWAIYTHTLTEDPTDPEVRIFMMFDWNANTTNLGAVFEFFYYPIKDFCGVVMSDAFFFGQVSQFDGVIYDETGTLPSGAGGLVTQAPLGGAGTQYDPLGVGMNFWDITDLTPSCGGSMRTQLGYTPGHSYSATIDISASTPPCVLRDAAIFLGRPRQCSSAATIFGPPTADFYFTSLDIDSSGAVQAEVAVPALWASGNDLSAAYSIEWFLRSKNVFSRLVDTNPDGVKVTLNASTQGWLFGEHYLEARVKHISSGSYVSVFSPKHGFYYNQQEAVFANGEYPTPDGYLDPGETMTLPVTMTNQSGESATGISITLGYDPGSGISMDTNSYLPSSSLPDGQGQDAEFDYQLLYVPGGCQDAHIFTKISHHRGAFTTSYTNWRWLTTNCQDIPVTFSAWDDWVPKSGDWAYDAENHSWSATAADASTTYVLESPNGHPDAIVGSDPVFIIDHDFAFDLNQAGGVLEYATSPDGVNWSAWHDLIEEIEEGEGVQLYHPLPFPDTVPSSIANRRVFMSLNPPTHQRIDGEADPNGFPIFKGDKVRFRALFQAPYLDQNRGLIQTWTINSFQFTSTQPRPDTLFSIPRYLNFISCLPVDLPVGDVDNYALEWYGDQSAAQDALYCLYNNSPASTDPDFSETVALWADYPPPQEDVATYFLKITKHATDEIRIIPFNMNVPLGNVPARSYMIPHWFLKPPDAESDLNEDGFVNIADFVKRENDDVCN